MILYEADNHHRQIYTDGRKLPEDFNLPAFYGYSAAHWEGVTRVVATAGFNDRPRSMPGATRTAPPTRRWSASGAATSDTGLRNNL
jgi:hypothetical protein